MVDWSYTQNNYDWLGHIVEALVMAAIVTLLVRVVVRSPAAVLVGLAFAVGHFHGREKRDYEISVHSLPPQLDGYLFWRWNWDQTTDFWPVLILLAAIGILVALRSEL